MTSAQLTEAETQLLMKLKMIWQQKWVTVLYRCVIAVCVQWDDLKSLHELLSDWDIFIRYRSSKTFFFS